LAFSSANLWAKTFPSKEKIKSVANSSYWKKLFHYEEGLFSGKSYADSDSFFLTVDGRSDLEAELEAHILAFQKIDHIHTPEKMPLQCAFPERFKFVSQSFPGIDFKKSKCPDFLRWKKAVIGKSVSLVFASSYVNNPSSMFGHTFLKFNQRDVENLSEDMFNYVVAFSAKSDSSPGILYALKGLFGAFKGVINVKPFYQTMKEYSKIESRDMWEYELNLDKDEIDSVINHLWELYANTNFDYYFFDENCTSVLARILDLVSLDVSYSENMSGYSLPTELVKSLNDNKKVKNIRYYPSLRKTFWSHYNQLSEKQIDDFDKIISGEQIKTDASTYQAAVHYLDYKRHDHENDIDEEFKKLQKSILSNAAKSGRAKEISIEAPESPHKGHLPAKIGLLLGTRGEDTVNTFSLRPLFHGLSDSDKGQEPWSAIELFKIDFNFNHDQNNVGIEEIIIADIQSLPNFTLLDKNVSWDLSLQVNPLIEDYKENALKTSFSMKLGLSKQSRAFLFSTMIGAKIEGHESFDSFVRVGPHAKLISGFLLGNAKLLLEAEYFHSLIGVDDISKMYYFDYNLGLSVPISEQGVLEVKTKAHGRRGTFSSPFLSHSAGVSIYY
jgi:hypothetical protein